MRVFRTLLLCTAAMAIAGCDDEDGLVGTAPNVPVAYTRFVNAVPDTGAQDWRFVDQLEYSPPAYALAFRGFTPYQATGVGSRHLRIFPTSTDIHVTSTRLIDTTITFQAGTYYTVIHVGEAEAGGTVAPGGENRIIVVQDDIPGTIAAGEFSIRAMNLGIGLGNVDVYGAPSTSAALPASALFSNVGFLSTTGDTSLATGAMALRALPAGQATPAMANSLAPAGNAGNAANNLSPIGGTGIGGSAMLAIFMPGSEPGTSAPQGAAFVTTTGADTTVRATATGYARSTGSFITNNFYVGQAIRIVGMDTEGNNGFGFITALQDFPRTGSITLERTATGYVRSTGSFITDGFTAGMDIYVTGFDSTGNVGAQTITAVTATELTVGVSVDLEEAAAGRSICHDPCSTMTVNKQGGPPVAEAANGLGLIRGPRPAWVYIIDRHPR